MHIMNVSILPNFSIVFMKMIFVWWVDLTPRPPHFLYPWLVCYHLFNLPFQRNLICPNDCFYWLSLFLYLLHMSRPVNISNLNSEHFILLSECMVAEVGFEMCLTNHLQINLFFFLMSGPLRSSWDTQSSVAWWGIVSSVCDHSDGFLFIVEFTKQITHIVVPSCIYFCFRFCLK